MPNRDCFRHWVIGAQWVLVFLMGCAHVEANYPDSTGPKKWKSNFEGQQCTINGVVFKVREKSDTLFVRNMIDSLREEMASKAGKAETDAGFKQAEIGHEYSVALREDRDYVFYRGSLTLEDDLEVLLQPGCLLLKVETEDGVVEVPDSGILFPRNFDVNNFQDTGAEPVQINLDYNNLLPGDENRIHVRSRVFGRILSVSVNPNKISIEK